MAGRQTEREAEGGGGECRSRCEEDAKGEQSETGHGARILSLLQKLQLELVPQNLMLPFEPLISAVEEVPSSLASSSPLETPPTGSSLLYTCRQCPCGCAWSAVRKLPSCQRDHQVPPT